MPSQASQSDQAGLCEARGLEQQTRLIEALRTVVEGLGAYRITRSTAASMLHAALLLRHRDQQLQQAPPSIQDVDGYGYGAVLERLAFDFAGSAPLGQHIALIAAMAETLQAGLADFHTTHRAYAPHKKHHDR